MAYVGHVKAIDNRLERVSVAISLKAPGNEAKRYPLTFQQSKAPISIWKLRKKYH